MIELLVVIAIIGILSSVVLASLNSARGKARDARRISDIKNLQLALELNADENNGNYAAALVDLVPNNISAVPKDPSTEEAYNYASAAAEYHIGATLENAANMPDNDADCDSSLAVPSTCFNVLTGGFNGVVGDPDLLYDQKD